MHLPAIVVLGDRLAVVVEQRHHRVGVARQPAGGDDVAVAGLGRDPEEGG